MRARGSRITQTHFVQLFRISYLVGASFTIVNRAASGFARPRLTLDEVCNQFLQLIGILLAIFVSIERHAIAEHRFWIWGTGCTGATRATRTLFSVECNRLPSRFG